MMDEIEFYKKRIKELMDRKDELRRDYPELFKDKSDYEMALHIFECLKIGTSMFSHQNEKTKSG